MILHQLNNIISQIIYTKGKHINRCFNTWEYNLQFGRARSLGSGISKMPFNAAKVKFTLTFGLK